MAKRICSSVMTATGTVVLALALSAGPAEAGKPNIMEMCKRAIRPPTASSAGESFSVSGEFKSLSVTVGPLVWIVKYGDDISR